MLYQITVSTVEPGYMCAHPSSVSYHGYCQGTTQHESFHIVVTVSILYVTTTLVTTTLLKQSTSWRYRL